MTNLVSIHLFLADRHINLTLLFPEDIFPSADEEDQEHSLEQGIACMLAVGKHWETLNAI